MPNPLLDLVKGWRSQQTQQVTKQFIADAGQPLLPEAGYVRLWFVEAFLADAKNWGKEAFPALHGGLSLGLAGGQGADLFASFTRSPEPVLAPGAQHNFALTPLLPYTGGVVEAHAAVFKAQTKGPLAAAMQVVQALAPLLGPPLANAAAIAGRVSDGLGAVFNSIPDRPVIAMHDGWAPPGGSLPELRSGYLVVADAPPGSLGTLSIVDGLLHADGRRPSGANYLVLWLECREEYEPWRLPQFESLAKEAILAFHRDDLGTYEAKRKEAVTAAWTTADLVAADQKRVVRLIQRYIDERTTAGAVPVGELSLEDAAEHLLPARDAPELLDLRLEELLRD